MARLRQRSHRHWVRASSTARDAHLAHACRDRLFLDGGTTRPLGILTTMNRRGAVADTTDWFQDFGKPPAPSAQWLARRRSVNETEGAS